MDLFFRKLGEGPPMIIVHGLYGSSDNWLSIGKSLAESHTVYLLDQRNHGQSPHSDVHDYTSMRDDLLGLMADIHEAIDGKQTVRQLYEHFKEQRGIGLPIFVSAIAFLSIIRLIASKKTVKKEVVKALQAGNK